MLNHLNKIFSQKSISSIALLLVASVFIFILPLFQEVNIWIMVILFSSIIFLATFSISARMVYIGLGAIILEILSKTTDFIYLHYVAEFVSNVTIIIIVGYVILEMMKRKKVNMYTLIEAINGYLLLGIMFMSLVSFCDQYIIGSYKGVTEASMDIPYYTIITLTTAGYGDITPTLPIAKSLSMFIAVTGQFYVAVIVAIIVGKYSNNAQE